MASQKHNPVSECWGKDRFDYRAQAKAVARRMARKRIRGRHVNVYRCTNCQGWHVGGKDNEAR